MTEDIDRLISGFDEGQMEGLRCILLKLATLKSEKFTGVSTIEFHASQGRVGDIYSWNKKKIKSSRKRRIRNKGINR